MAVAAEAPSPASGDPEERDSGHGECLHVEVLSILTRQHREIGKEATPPKHSNFQDSGNER